MAKKGGKFKSLVLALLFLVLLAFVFVIMGGGNLLRSAGSWIGGVGTKADEVKGTIEHKATNVEKTVQKLKEDVKPGEKK